MSFSLGCRRLMRVQGHSMAPTLHHGELVVISACADSSPSPQRGDLVAARPAACGGRAVVKRLAGVPQDVVECSGVCWRLQADQFFLLGDAMDDSTDSRRFGPISRQELIGTVKLRVWPPKWFVRCG